MDLPRAPAILDAILGRHAGALGDDQAPYANHCHRVFAFARLLDPDVDPDLLAIVCAFHDLGIWTAGTFDYLGPSVALAADHLQGTGADAATVDAVADAIDGHHKVTAHPAGAPLAEAVRRADWADVTCGTRRFGLPRAAMRAAYDAFPDAGFHRRLMGLTWHRMRRHPLSPLPMMRW